MTGSLTTARFHPALEDPGIRAAVCHWLAGLFLKPPAEEEIAAYRDGPAEEWLALLAAAPEFAAAIAMMKRSLDPRRSALEIANTLGIQFNRLFTGAGGPSGVAPYESAFTGTGRLYQQPASDMNILLCRHGLHVAEAWAEAPDHISVQLALAAHLLSSGHHDAAVLSTRMKAWTQSFAAACSARDTTGFWSGAAQLAAAMTRINATALQSDTLVPETGGCDDTFLEA